MRCSTSARDVRYGRDEPPNGKEAFVRILSAVVLASTAFFLVTGARAQVGGNPDGGARQQGDSPAPAASPPPPTLVEQQDVDRRVERVLPLCESTELATRRFCIEELARSGDPSRLAYARLRRIALESTELHELAATTMWQLYHEAAPGLEGPEKTSYRRDPGRTHLVFFPTAFTTERGEVSWDIVNLAYWDLNYGLSDNVEIGLRTGPPIGVFVIAPQVKFALKFEGGSVALHLLGGTLIPFFDSGRDNKIVFGGGGPTLSLGEPELFFNVGVEAYVFGGSTNQTADLLLPHVGGSVRMSERLTLNAEVIVPGYRLNDWEGFQVGKVALVLYGFRVVGGSMWGDISFAAPICHGCGELYRFLPLGVPLLGFGFAW